MSREQIELRRLATIERQRVWQHAARLPGRAGDALGAFARRHPGLAMGGAAALALGICVRGAKRRETSITPGASWPMALAAVGVRILPDLLKLAGLTVADETESTDTADTNLPRSD